MVEGQKMCEAKSMNWKGMCMKWRKCRQVCISQVISGNRVPVRVSGSDRVLPYIHGPSFTDGRCKGFTRNCICSKLCFVPSN
ncbi:hypothetical protein ARALYDRAFT_497242 [Arabidopsis lyrata subsp. lyrata]|uniref:Knottins-like domain-containing protein n=1 Tax=Arabidopsis lyrata subsp. lyrata TaxID=81972 RepID=D7MW87_ARALL|nr:hypothetical protein ARALYDRAFT_497242 [Arabidopsis lyrata subsp. lyrata]